MKTLKKLLKNKWFIIGIIVLVISIILLIIFLIWFRPWLKGILAVLTAGGSIFAIKKSYEFAKENIDKINLKKEEDIEKTNNNTVDDNRNFGLSFIKRRRNKNNK